MEGNKILPNGRYTKLVEVCHILVGCEFRLRYFLLWMGVAIYSVVYEDRFVERGGRERSERDERESDREKRRTREEKR